MGGIGHFLHKTWHNLDFGAGLRNNLLGGGSHGDRGRAALLAQITQNDRLRFGAAQNAFTAQPGIIQQGYKLARKSIGEASGGAMRAAVDQGKVAEGNALNRLTNAGYSGASSIAGNMRIGIGYNTARAIQDIQGRVGAIGAQLATGEASDLVGAQGQIGNFMMQRGLAERDPLESQINLNEARMSEENARQQQNIQGLASLAALFSFA